MLTHQKQKGKHESPGKQQFGVLTFKAQTDDHALHRLKDQIAQKQRPPNGNHDTQNIVCDRSHLTEIAEIHLKNFQKRICDILDHLKAQAVNPLNKALKNSFKNKNHLPTGVWLRGLLNGGQAVKKRPDIGQEGAHSVNDGPSDPDTLEPVPCLIGFMLVIGNFGSNHSNGRHQAGQHGADPGNLVIDIDDDTVCGRPHILYGQSWRNHIGHNQNKRHYLNIIAGGL
ncbi:hypothetical protein ABHB30_06260 [Flavonifractor plautii]|uniref:hypothetical protein n=1 Tax=Flavonifractor plautii TaxID=292800 RepID=UPI00325B02A5